MINPFSEFHKAKDLNNNFENNELTQGSKSLISSEDNKKLIDSLNDSILHIMKINNNNNTSSSRNAKQKKNSINNNSSELFWWIIFEKIFRYLNQVFTIEIYVSNFF